MKRSYNTIAISVLSGFLFFGQVYCSSHVCSETAKQIDIFGSLGLEGVQHKALPLLLTYLVGSEKGTAQVMNSELKAIAYKVAENLQKTGQFSVMVKECVAPLTAGDLKHLFQKEYPLALFLQEGASACSIEWRLYDVPDEYLIKGKKYAKRGKTVYGYAANIADDIWPVLTKQSSSFSTKIAYVKRKKTVSKRQLSVVCIANSDGSHEQELIKKPGTYVGLYWHHDKSFPCLFCSEFTRFNVRLISASLRGKKNIVLNLEGTCVGISVAHDNNKAAYCRSGTIWHHSYDAVEKRGVHTVLIKNEGKNVSPTLLENGDVIFCSDSKQLKQKYPQANGPQICYYTAADKSISLITQDGYCVGPSYCALTKKIAYSKKVKGVMQLWVYDCISKKHLQITFDEGNKIDCCWSPCGNYLTYCYQNKRESRIAVIHVVLKIRFFITPANEYCMSPSWSPVYDTVPQIYA
ncbi:hypothetical protein H0X06_01210 [Candidatus Dependentiae bacterium]|nr:hypothetical protein [Candidatus Dependentiae bacterium]